MIPKMTCQMAPKKTCQMAPKKTCQMAPKKTCQIFGTINYCSRNVEERQHFLYRLRQLAKLTKCDQAHKVRSQRCSTAPACPKCWGTATPSLQASAARQVHKVRSQRCSTAPACPKCWGTATPSLQASAARTCLPEMLRNGNTFFIGFGSSLTAIIYSVADGSCQHWTLMYWW